MDSRRESNHLITYKASEFFSKLLKLFKRHIEKEQRQWLDREAKWFLSAFGPTRDLDVLVTELIPAVKGVENQVAFKALRTAAMAARVAAFRSAVRALRTTRYQRFMIRLDMWLEGASWRSADRSGATIETAAADIISRRLAKLVARGDTLDRMNPAERHATRIAAKKCRYGLEFFQDVLPRRRAAKLFQILKSIQDGLGHSNDVTTATELVETLADSPLAPNVRKLITTGGRRLIAHHAKLDRRSRGKTDGHWSALQRNVSDFRIQT